MLSSSGSSSLLAICPDRNSSHWGIALLDISTGEFFVTIVDHDNGFLNILSEIARNRPAECIAPSTITDDLRQKIRDRGVVVSCLDEREFSEQRARNTLLEHFHVVSLAGYGCDDLPAAIAAAGAALSYAKETQRSVFDPYQQSLFAFI